MTIKRKSTFSRMLGLIFLSVGWFVFVGVCWYGFMRFELYSAIPKINSFETFSKVQGLFQGFVTLLFGIGPAVIFWYFRDQAKHIDQEHTERDLVIKENNDAWKNFIEYQKMAESTENSEGTRAAAIYALGEYYTRPLESNFPFQVHSFFRCYLDNCWKAQPEYIDYQKERLQYAKNKKETIPEDDFYEAVVAAKDRLLRQKTPEYICAVHKVMQAKSQRFFLEQTTQPLLRWKQQKRLNFFCSKNGLHLTGFNLFNSDLEEVNFEDVSIEKAYLERANLRGANLEGANLERANLEDANLERANLEDANLERANLERAHLKGANLERAHLKGAHLGEAYLEEANLEEANLEGAYLKEAHFTDVHLEGANLEWAHLELANLGWAHLEGAHLKGAHLDGAHLEKADFEGAVLEGANLKEANFRRANLEEAHLEGANLSTAKQLDKACLKNTRYNDTTQFPPGFDPEKAGMVHVP